MKENSFLKVKVLFLQAHNHYLIIPYLSGYGTVSWKKETPMTYYLIMDKESLGKLKEKLNGVALIEEEK